MYISINWIKDFVDLTDIDIENLIYKFTMSTAEVEGITKYGFETCGVVVGKIESIEKVENYAEISSISYDDYYTISLYEYRGICRVRNRKQGTDKLARMGI